MLFLVGRLLEKVKYNSSEGCDKYDKYEFEKNAENDEIHTRRSG